MMPWYIDQISNFNFKLLRTTIDFQPCNSKVFTLYPYSWYNARYYGLSPSYPSTINR
jgi:hypothetical protein